jgi:hypothetical protein
MPVIAGVLNPYPYGSVQAGAMIGLADVGAAVLALEGQTIKENGRVISLFCFIPGFVDRPDEFNVLSKIGVHTDNHGNISHPCSS